MNDGDFDFLRRLLHERSGLSLTPDKHYLIESRLGILCRRLALPGLDALIERLRRAGDPDLETAVVEAMTTNETFFFRDRSPFDLFRGTLLPELLARNAATRSLRIWCAAVSSGQEAYSLAMILDEHAGRLAGWKVEILGTDISGEVLARARDALYTQFEVQRGLPVQMLLRHFLQEGDKWRVAPHIRDRVELRRHNLLEPCAQLGRFDIIFCRNVLIYFDLPTKTKVLSSIAAQLAPGGALILGAAETAIGLTTAVAADPEHRGLFRAPAAFDAAGRHRPSPPLSARG